MQRARGAPVARAPEAIRPLTGELTDYDALIERASAARYVLLGEASHGTHEFYRERAEITKRLIAEAGFTAVAVEADWPDAYRVNRYVRGENDDRTADQALSDFRRFPVWMWRNAEVAEFVELLREWNDALPRGAQKVGFYGLDLYSLHRSMEAVIEFLDEADPEAAQRARERYACFDQFGRDPQVYAYEAGIAGADPCEQQVVEQLLELQGMAAPRRRRRSPRPGRALLRRAERAPGRQRGGVLPGDVPRRRRELEPARPAHGPDARSADRASRADVRADEGGRVGAQLAPRRCARDRARPGRRAQRRPAGARPRRRSRAARRLHDLLGHGDRGIRLGRPG